MSVEIKSIGVLIDDITSIIKAVVPYNIDINIVEPGTSFKMVIWISTSPYSIDSLVGKKWLPDGTFEDPPVEHTWDQVREKRDVALSYTDWTQVGDAPLSSEKVQEFAVWRQQLRDLPQQYATPDEALVALEVLLNNKP